MRTALADKGSIATVDPRQISKASTFAEFADTWMRDYVEINNKPSERATKRYVLSSTLIPFFGDLRLSEVSAHSVERFKRTCLDAGRSPKTVNNYLSILRKALAVAVDWEVLERVPRVQFLRFQSRPRQPLPFGDFIRIAACAETPFWKSMILVAGYLGLRFDEVAALEWRDINYPGGEVHIRRSFWRGHLTDSTKTYRKRELPLTNTICDALSELPRVGNLVFSHDGDFVPYATARRRLREACVRAGLAPVGWHILRHTNLTELGRLGVEVHTIKAMAGHSDIRTTMIYVKALPEMKARAAALLDDAHRSAFVQEDSAAGRQAGAAIPGAVSPSSRQNLAA